MTDGIRVHLSAWHPPEICHYLVNEVENSEHEFEDIGWNSFPSWTVAKDYDRALDAVDVFLSKRKLDGSVSWRDEVLAL